MNNPDNTVGAITAAVLIGAASCQAPAAPEQSVTLQAPRRDDERHIIEATDTAPVPSPQAAEQAPPPVHYTITPGAGQLSVDGQPALLAVA